MAITLMRRRRARRDVDKQDASPRIPPVLPVVTMTVQSDATVRVAVDGVPIGPPTFAPPWRRHSFAQIISEIVEQRHSPVRVVVHELDGTDYTDIVAAPLHAMPFELPASERAPAMNPAVEAEQEEGESPHLLAVQGDEGFVPGEEVAVAVIIRHTGAGAEGAARVLIEPALLDLSPTHEVILLGRVSGTCIVGHPS